MSMAFEITTDDLEIILNNHKINMGESDLENILEELDMDQVEKEALAYNALENQTNSAYDCIENQLMAKGIIPSSNDKLYGDGISQQAEEDDAEEHFGDEEDE